MVQIQAEYDITKNQIGRWQKKKIGWDCTGIEYITQSDTPVH